MELLIHSLRDARNRRTRLHRPVIERVEGRLLMTNFTVTTTSDSGDGSLRNAIETANATPGQNTINFNIPARDFNQGTIDLLSPLPALTNPVIINGTSQPGFIGSAPVIELYGEGAGAGANGLTIDGGDSTVQGLTIDNFSGAQIEIANAGGDTISGDFIGTDPSGDYARQSGGAGVIVHADHNTVGGFTISARNLISGNSGDGVTVIGSNNHIANNEIGTNAGATLPVANGGNGVTVVSGTDNLIGGVTGNASNVITGNRQDGILLESSGNLVQGNFVGITAGSIIISNGGDGIGVTNGSDNTIGGSVALATNYVSGNQGNGIAITGAGSMSNLVIGDVIGANSTMATGFGNGLNGILITGGSSNDTIGGGATGFANVISANQDNGVSVENGSANLIQGNFVGTDPTGTINLGNELDGVIINGNANRTGGPIVADRNTIRFNDRAGVHIASGQNNPIQSNSIYTNDLGGIQLDPPSNGQISAPVLRSVTVFQSSATSTTTQNNRTVINGMLKGTPNTKHYTIQFFTNTALDPSGPGEGQTFLGAITVRAGRGGVIRFQTTIHTAIAAGLFVTATATDPNLNTSVFSNPSTPIVRIIPAATTAITSTSTSVS